jgi:hypothetical protein
MTEHAIKRAVMKYLGGVSKKTGGRILARKTHGSAYGTRGEPDIIGCGAICGHLPISRAFVIELKQPGEQPTKLQTARLQEWARAGAATAVATSVVQVRDFLRLTFGDLSELE